MTIQNFDNNSVITPNVVEGYGLTETTAAGSVQKPGDYFSGRIGPPSPCCEIKLVDIPEMNYLSTDKPCPRGEIYIKGAVVSPGYFNNKEKTAEVCLCLCCFVVCDCVVLYDCVSIFQSFHV